MIDLTSNELIVNLESAGELELLGELSDHERSNLYFQAANVIRRLVRERDFMYDYIPRQCNTCGNYVCTVDSFGISSYGCDKGGCADWKRKENWEWRGVQNE